MKILQVNTYDTRGGAARVATSLHQAFRSRGHESWLAVGHKLGDDPHILPVGQSLSDRSWQHQIGRVENVVARRRFRGARMLRSTLRMVANPYHIVDWYRGYEDFRYLSTKHLLDLPGTAVDILHLHNLHGHYFDLRQLPNLTREIPTIISLHDAWLLSGHCAFSFGCDRWQTGCGNCPDLDIQPAIRRDATAENWQRKKGIYSISNYHVIAPSKWLGDKLTDSPLAAGLLSSRVIPHGIDLNIFQPNDKTSARHKLGLPETGPIILMVANGFRDNPWKDFNTARKVFRQLARIVKMQRITVIALGDSLPDEQYGNVLVRFVPYIRDSTHLSSYYQAADLLLSTSKVEVWGLAISEALACGTPVVATAVGGVPEQITSWYQNDANSANGILATPEDAIGLADGLAFLLNDSSLRQRLGQTASIRARTELDFETQVERYLSFYREILKWDNNG